MTLIEDRKSGYAVRWYVKGEKTPSGKPKVKTEWFDDRREAEWFAKQGKLRPLNLNEAVERLSEGFGVKRKSAPRFLDYAHAVIDSDPNIQQTSRDAYRNTPPILYRNVKEVSDAAIDNRDETRPLPR